MIDEQYCAEIRSKLTEPCLDHGYTGNHLGYARCYVKSLKAYRLCHRVSYCEHHGIPLSEIDGKVVMHLCDNPRCIEPTHLQLGTQKDNMQDASKKGRKRNWRVLREPSKYLYQEFNDLDLNDYVK